MRSGTRVIGVCDERTMGVALGRATAMGRATVWDRGHDGHAPWGERRRAMGRAIEQGAGSDGHAGSGGDTGVGAGWFEPLGEEAEGLVPSASARVGQAADGRDNPHWRHVVGGSVQGENFRERWNSSLERGLARRTRAMRLPPGPRVKRLALLPNRNAATPSERVFARSCTTVVARRE